MDLVISVVVTTNLGRCNYQIETRVKTLLKKEESPQSPLSRDFATPVLTI